MLLEVKRIIVPPGQTVVLDGVSWAEFESILFANFSLIEVIPQYLNQCRIKGRNKGVKAFRSWVKKQLQNI